MSESHAKIQDLLFQIHNLQWQLEDAQDEIRRLEGELKETQELTTLEIMGPEPVFYHELNKDEGAIPPEQRPELLYAKRRIKLAAKMFNANFNNLGQPVTDLGRELFKKYGGY